MSISAVIISMLAMSLAISGFSGDPGVDDPGIYSTTTYDMHTGSPVSLSKRNETLVHTAFGAPRIESRSFRLFCFLSLLLHITLQFVGLHFQTAVPALPACRPPASSSVGHMGLGRHSRHEGVQPPSQAKSRLGDLLLDNVHGALGVAVVAEQEVAALDEAAVGVVADDGVGVARPLLGAERVPPRVQVAQGPGRPRLAERVVPGPRHQVGEEGVQRRCGRALGRQRRQCVQDLAVPHLQSDMDC